MLLFVAVNSSYVHTNIAVRYFYHLCKDKAECSFVEYNINQDFHYVLYDILQYKPSILALSVYIWNRKYIEKITEAVKKIDENIQIIVGGPEVWFDDKKDWPFVDYIVKGEGEYLFLDLCKTHTLNALKDNYPLFELDKLPFAYSSEKIIENKIYYYEASRGCPFKCSYCLSSLDKPIRYSSIDKVFDELSYLFSKKVKLIKFVDRTFNIDIDRCINIIEFCKKNASDTQVHFEIDPTLLCDDIILALNNSKKNLFRLEIGLQSFHPITLQAIGRNFDFEKIDRNLKHLIEKGNCIVHLDLIAGLPFEDYKTFLRSLDKTIYYFPDEIQLGFLKMLKGTRIKEEDEKYNYKYLNNPPYEILSNEFMNFLDIFKLKKIEALIDKLYNQNLLKNTLKYILRKTNPSKFLEKLSDEIDISQNIRMLILSLYEYISKQKVIDNEILINLFRYDIVSKLSEEYLPEEIRYNKEEKQAMKNAIYNYSDFQDLNLNHAKEILRRYKYGFFTIDVEELIFKDQTIFNNNVCIFLKDNIIKMYISF